MKRYVLYMLAMMMVISIFPSKAECKVILKPKWRDLDGNSTKAAQFGGKWILVGSITFKRCKDPICLDTINLHWHGDYLDNLIASLYKKDLDKDVFMPIEENLVCDGVWSKSKQTLVLNFEERENLAPTTVFYLVLTVPEELEPILKKGSFCLEEQCLPKPFKQYAQQEKLSLAFN